MRACIAGTETPIDANWPVNPCQKWPATLEPTALGDCGRTHLHRHDRFHLQNRRPIRGNVRRLKS